MFFNACNVYVFDAIGKPSVKNQTLENRSSLINRYIYKVLKLSLSNTVVAFPVTSILQQCVHVPVKHSETDFIILQPNLLNIINVYSSFSCTVNCATLFMKHFVSCVSCVCICITIIHCMDGI